ncbi:MAG TPA: hypothetical protein VGQ69_10190 [Gemmatimonadales bacterium]|jgi:hypothetical protein|nr:hypothetical protein [Gemmatimonadales bacterium]
MQGAATATKGVAGQAEVQALLNRMARAITQGDGKTVASMWAVPALVLGDTEARAVGTLDEVKAFFGGAKEQYNAKGIVDTRAEIRELKWLTPRIALVEVRWPYLDEQGKEVGEETSTYALRRDETGILKLQTAIMHGAAEQPPS